jgi:hypothetical protein
VCLLAFPGLWYEGETRNAHDRQVHLRSVESILIEGLFNFVGGSGGCRNLIWRSLADKKATRVLASVKSCTQGLMQEGVVLGYVLGNWRRKKTFLLNAPRPSIQRFLTAVLSSSGPSSPPFVALLDASNGRRWSRGRASRPWWWLAPRW